MTNDLNDSQKWQALMQYMKGWPYSEYTDLERAELVNVIRSLKKDGEVRTWSNGELR